MVASVYSESLGSAIRARRRALGLSQAVLAKAAKVNREVISAIERGEYDPTLDLLMAIAARLRLPASELLAKAEKL